MADQVRDIAVEQDKKKIVSDATERIHLLFNVQVALSVPEAAGIQWVQLKGTIEDIENAKNYINSLCKPDIKDVKVPIPEAYFDAISEYRNHVERTSGAVVLFSSPREACIQGSEMAVVIATSAIEERINELKAGASGLPSMVQSSIPQQRQKVEQEKVQSSPVPYIDPSLEEFAIKLGYTKEDIHQVVKNQGKEVDQNTLLRELIKVSSPSLLQRARPEYASHPAVSKPGSYYKDEVVARGAPSRPVPQPFPFIDQMKKEDIVARGAMPRPAPRPFTRDPGSDIVARGAMAQPAIRPFPMDSSSVQGGYPPSDRQAYQYVSDRPEDDALMYQQVIGNSSATVDTTSDLRRIVIDGSNVAMSHGNQQYFSCKGIKICVEYFKKRGHKDITVFVPQWRKESAKPDAPIRDQEILAELEAERHLVFTPSRRINGRRIVCYDDRFIIKLANDTDGVVVSNDHFRDLFSESPQWQEVIEQRILMYSFVNDIFMVPDDPLGRHGPKLDDFLRKGTANHRRVCPYLRRCTYGPRCKYYHPERETETKKPQVRYDFQVGPRSATFRELVAMFSKEKEHLIRQVMRENPHADLVYLVDLMLKSTQ